MATMAKEKVEAEPSVAQDTSQEMRGRFNPNLEVRVSTLGPIERTTPGATETPLGAVTHKLHEARRLLRPSDCFALLDSLFDIQAASIEQVVGTLHIRPSLASHPLAAHADGIDSTDHIDDLTYRKGRDILAPGCAAANHAHLPDA